MISKKSNHIAITTLFSGVIGLLALLGGLWFMANAQNTTSLKSENQLIAGGIRAQETTLRKFSLDYSTWTDFYKAAQAKDIEWLKENVGGTVYNTHTVDLTVIFDSATQPVGAWEVNAGQDNVLQKVDPALFEAVKTAIPKIAPTETGSFTTFMNINGQPALVAISRIISGDSASQPVQNVNPAFAMVIYLTPERLSQIGESFFIEGLKISKTGGEAQVELRDNTGQPFANLVWMAATPGTQTLYSVVLPLGLFASAFLLFSGYLAFRTQRQVELAEHLAREDAAGAHNELLKSTKMAQLGQLTATVAHEIRNPLGSIRTTTFLLRRKLFGQSENFKTLLDRIENGVTRCEDIILQLLDFSRSNDLSTKAVAFDDWLQETVTMACETISNTVTVECELGLGDMMVDIDQARLERVIFNLISNAAEAIAPSDKAGSSSQALVKVESKHIPNGIEVLVTDNGLGIPENLREKIMTPLFTTKSFGTGLGLSASANVVERHGGKLSFTDAPGGGTTFKFWLPVLAPPKMLEAA